MDHGTYAELRVAGIHIMEWTGGTLVKPFDYFAERFFQQTASIKNMRNRLIQLTFYADFRKLNSVQFILIHSFMSEF